MTIDAHCHIDMYKNPRQILAECERTGTTVLAMTNLPSHFEMGYPHVQHCTKVRLALGLHPLYAERHEIELPLFLKLLPETSYIGEIGLDFSREGYPSKDVQLRTFKKVLEAVSGKRKILSLHSRRAEKEVLALLLHYNIRGAVFHWYSGPLSLIDKITEAGFYFSINAAMTASESGRKIICKAHMDYILTETDGPFIEINGKVMLPYEMGNLVAELARIKNVTVGVMEAAITYNFHRLINLLRGN